MDHSHIPRNPAQLLGVGNNPAVRLLLRACGVDEAYILGQAADYDCFLALAAALPLCEGHPLQAQVQGILREATGLTAPLCPHTASIYWDTWVEKYWYGREAPQPCLPDRCPLCGSSMPTILGKGEVFRFPELRMIRAGDLSAWSEALVAAIPENCQYVRLDIPLNYIFTRPNPYHAQLAVSKSAQGEALTEKERDLLIAQALRAWGLAGTKTSILLCGGRASEIVALLSYLHNAKALPTLVWLPEQASDAGAVSGLYPSVRTGYLHRTEEEKHAYAAVAPIGRAIVLE